MFQNIREKVKNFYERTTKKRTAKVKNIYLHQHLWFCGKNKQTNKKIVKS